MAIAVVIPSRFGEYRPAAQIYARRRLMALLTLAAIVLVLLVSAGHVVANRGGAPASASAIRPATALTSPSSPSPSSPSPSSPSPSSTGTVYIVKAGDTLWSIGQRFHGRTALADYVDSLVSTNGGTRLQVSQALTLP